MPYRLTGLAVAGIALLSVSACTTATETSGSGGASAPTPTRTAAPSTERVKLTRSQVLALYTGKTLRGAGHSQTYRADGTWVNNSGRQGRWSVAPDGTLVMTGDLDMRLAVFREGNRFYHRNTRTGSGGYYQIS